MFGRSNEFGCLGDGAMGELDQISTTGMDQQHVYFRLTCIKCGREQQIGIGWQQILECAMFPKTKRLPVDPDTQSPWQVIKGHLVPQIGCSNCRSPLNFGITPEEAHTYLVKGQSEGFIKLQ